MVQRNKGLNFTIRFKGGGNFASINNPIERMNELIEPPVVACPDDAIAAESGDSLLTETSECIIIEDAVMPQKAMSLDYTDLSTVTFSGEMVTAWLDISSSVTYSAQAGEEPVSGTSDNGGTIGFFGSGQESIRFQTSSVDADGLQTSGQAALDSTVHLHTGNMTFVIVTRWADTGATQYLFDTARGNAAAIGFSFFLQSGGAVQARICNGTGTFLAMPVIDNVGDGDQIFVVRCDGSQCQLMAMSHSAQVFDWGASSGDFTGSASTADSTYQPSIGSSSRNSNTSVLSGNIGEICSWDEAIPDSQLSGALAVLAFKWNMFGAGE